MTLKKAQAALGVMDPQAPVPIDRMGPHLLDRLLAEGRYRVDGGHLMAGEKPLTVAVFARLVRHLAGTFGRFFLQFQETHPAVGILCCADEPEAYRLAGRAACWLGLEARARGFSSIVKSGPIDLAGSGIRELLGTPLVPVITFQVGWPLGPDEPVGDHDGLEERRRDRRPPRADLAAFYGINRG